MKAFRPLPNTSPYTNLMQIIELANEHLRVNLIEYGARVVAIHLRGKSVNQEHNTEESSNLVQGYQKLKDYLTDEASMGATVGPITNRISSSRITLDNKTYRLPNNKGENCLHSGGVGFDRRMWSLSQRGQNFATFSLPFDLADIGLPGQLEACAKYFLSGSTLSVEYTISTSSLTYLNVTNHVYLNLSGENRSIDDHQFLLFADQVVLTDKDSIPTGKTIGVNNPLKYCLNSTRSFIDWLSENADSIYAGGIDHHFVAQAEGAKQWLKLAKVRSESSGIAVDIFSNAPGFQLYTANSLTGEFEPQSAFCIEAQSIPDAINHPEFKVELTPAGSSYSRSIAWNFSYTT